MGHRVTIITARHSEQVATCEKQDELEIRRIDVRDAYYLRKLPWAGRYVRSLQNLQYSWKVNQVIRQVHQQDTIDVVEFAEINGEAFFFARKPLVPFVVRCHTPTFVLQRHYLAAENPHNETLTIYAEKACLRRASALTAPSGHLAGEIAGELSLPKNQIHVIPNALDVTIFSPYNSETIKTNKGANAEITILHVGRLERVKGIEVLAHAIPGISRSVPNTRFIFIGDDRPDEHGESWRKRLEAYFREQNLLNRVIFLGGIGQKELLDWYQRADIAVVPTLNYESFSYTCAQAMAAGLPVVASRIGGIPETVEDGVSGLLLEPGNVQDLRGAVIKLAQDPALRRQMGQAGRQRAAKYFSAEIIARKTLEIYHQLVG